MPLDSLQVQLTSALQRYAALQRRAGMQADPLLVRTLAELGTALEELRVAQEQILENQHSMDQLQADLSAQCARYWELFDELPEAYLVTKPDTTILEANRAAAELLNVSQRFLVGKTLSVFVCEDRAGFLAVASKVGSAESRDNGSELKLKLRPRERAPLCVAARIRGSAEAVRWTLRPCSAPSPSETESTQTM